ncbi:thiolase family protein [Patescibacteria group bacterium]
MERLQKLLQEDPIVIVGEPKRLPRADILENNKAPGLFSHFTTNQLGGLALAATLKATPQIEPSMLGHVVMGRADHAHRDCIYGARGMALEAGIPHDVPACTVQRICASGVQGIITATTQVVVGDHLPGRPYVAAGGAESMQYPHKLPGMRGRKVGGATVKFGPIDASKLPKGTYLQDAMFMGLFDPRAGMAMANTAEELARRFNITREQADVFAHRSHKLAITARDNGYFDDEIEPVTNLHGDIVENDTHILDDISMGGLAGLRVAFEEGGIITPGNASAVVDGAAAMIMCPLSAADEVGAKPIARIVSWGIAGCDPKIMGWGPVPSTRFALENAGLKGNDISTVELNEAFAPQALACIMDFEKEFGIDPEKVNPMGNAIAMGHPLGATGAILTVTAAHRMRRLNQRYGLITMCVGGGQGVSLIIENAEFM